MHAFGQAELFSDLVHRQLGAPPRANEHGVFEEADEVLSLFDTAKRSNPWPMAEIELIQVPGKGWIGAYAFFFSMGVRSGPLNLERPMAKAETRLDCLGQCCIKLADWIKDYERHHGKATKQTRRALAWIAKGCTA
jgi:hypothetical protein